MERPNTVAGLVETRRVTLANLRLAQADAKRLTAEKTTFGGRGEGSKLPLMSEAGGQPDFHRSRTADTANGDFLDQPSYVPTTRPGRRGVQSPALQLA